MMLQQDGGVGAHNAGGQGAAHRSARTSIDNDNLQRLSFPVNGGSTGGGAGAVITNMNDHVSTYSNA